MTGSPPTGSPPPIDSIQHLLNFPDFIVALKVAGLQIQLDPQFVSSIKSNLSDPNFIDALKVAGLQIVQI
jgi:hypothetical protein